MLAPSAIAVYRPLSIRYALRPPFHRMVVSDSFSLGALFWALVDRPGTICITWAMANSVQEPLIMFQEAVTETLESVASQASCK